MPDFEALRAERNRQHDEWVEKMRADGWELARTIDPDACYCNCGREGVEHACEHTWDGPEYVSPDGLMSSSTCGCCGMTSYSHSLRMGM